MTKKAREAIAYLRRITEEWDDDGMAMSASYMADVADTLEAELLRCRVETLQEAAATALATEPDSCLAPGPDTGDILIAELGIQGAVRSILNMLRMAEEAEREARDEIHN